MSLKLRADLGQLSRIREFVTDSAAAAGCAPTSFDDLRLAVDEAVTNILTHAYGGPGDIELDVATSGPDLVVRIRDHAPPFDPGLSHPDNPQDSGNHHTPGGFGLFLIQSAMDEVTYQSLDDGNELTLIKRNVRLRD